METSEAIADHGFDYESERSLRQSPPACEPRAAPLSVCGRKVRASMIASTATIQQPTTPPSPAETWRLERAVASHPSL